MARALAPPPFDSLPADVRAIFDRIASTEHLVADRHRGVPHVALLLKRTYDVDAEGRCRIASDDDQEFVVEEIALTEKLDAPQIAPVALDDDTAGTYRQRTDLVVQGSAQSYGRTIDRSHVTLRVHAVERRIEVRGDRVARFTEDGEVRFGPPEPFDTMPICYSRAYGGYDAAAAERYAFPDLEGMQGRWTPLHYPRNPSGRGFVVEATPESIEGLALPNLEFPFDPVTPDRLAAGSLDGWPRAPLPASMGWTLPISFPRIAYLGLARVVDLEGPLPEVELGWAPKDLMETPSLLDDARAGRVEFLQAASPGMVFDDLGPGSVLEIENMHPDHPLWRVELPRERPRARMALSGLLLSDLTPHLNAVVVRPDESRVVMSWCARKEVPIPVTLEQALDMRREVEWRETPPHPSPLPQPVARSAPPRT